MGSVRRFATRYIWFRSCTEKQEVWGGLPQGPREQVRLRPQQWQHPSRGSLLIWPMQFKSNSQHCQNTTTHLHECVKSKH